MLFNECLSFVKYELTESIYLILESMWHLRQKLKAKKYTNFKGYKRTKRFAKKCECKNFRSHFAFFRENNKANTKKNFAKMRIFLFLYFNKCLMKKIGSTSYLFKFTSVRPKYIRFRHIFTLFFAKILHFQYRENFAFFCETDWSVKRTIREQDQTNLSYIFWVFIFMLNSIHVHRLIHVHKRTGRKWIDFICIMQYWEQLVKSSRRFPGY